jgi:integrase
MPRLTKKLPSYRLHKPSGRAVVTLGGRDHYLGPWGSPESKAEYRRLIAEWITAGRGVAKPDPGKGTANGAPAAAPTVSEVILAYWRHAETHYRTPDGEPSRELENIQDALRPLRKLYGRSPARDFGPLALRAVRDEMVRSKSLARTSINARINRIRRVFRWAASVELIPAAVVAALQTVDGLRQGRTDAREPKGVKPVPEGHVEAVLPHLPKPVAAMVRVQVLTGCRAGEVVRMRGRDLTQDGPIWEYRPARHKNRWRGQARVIPLGPRAQEVVKAFLKPDPSAYLFSSADVVSEMHLRRRASRRSKPTPSELARRCQGSPGRKHAARYDRRTYRQAIVRACHKAGVPPWSPLQLRHAAATAIRARYGLEAAQAVLGHAKPDTTLIYAERDLARAREVMAEIG